MSKFYRITIKDTWFWKMLIIRTVNLTFAEKLARFINESNCCTDIAYPLAVLDLCWNCIHRALDFLVLWELVRCYYFFTGIYVAGFAGYETLILFVVGVILISCRIVFTWRNIWYH